MRDKDYTTSSDFLKRLFGETLHKVELRACPNVRGEVPPASIMTRDTDAIEAFCRKHDGDDMGVYFGTCTRLDDTKKGNKENVAECPALWVDIDCVKQGIKGKDALQALQSLPFPPTIILNSGGGLHAYWVLENPEPVSGAYSGVERLCRQLALILGGDTSCAEAARIMRLPGTVNSKPATRERHNGKPALVEVIEDTGRVYDLESLAEWLSEQRAVLHSTVKPAVQAVRESDPFVQYARVEGYEPALDIDAELAAMGEGNIHQTQLRVSMSMLARGYDEDEIVARILSATEHAAPGGANWNWAREEKAIRDMVRSGRGKVETRRDEPHRAAQPLRSDGNAARKLELVHDADRGPKADRKPKQKVDKTDEITALGGAALGVWHDRYGPIKHSGGTSYTYQDGVWEMWGQTHDQMLRVLIQEAAASLGMKPATSLLNAAERWVKERPELLEQNVRWDQHGLIIAGDGVLNLKTMEIGDHSPDHNAMFKVAANLQGPKECTSFLAFLAESFADKDPAELPGIISTIQEWIGASLVTNKPRALRKGLMAHGGSRTGKTQLSEIERALLGEGQTCGMKAKDLEKDFGTQALVGKRGWIADDAVGRNEYLDAENYKVIVTGEQMSVRRKNTTNVEMRFSGPVMITMNNLPRIRDGSDAVYNRSLVLPMTNSRPETAPEPLGYESIAAKIISEELTGVLWWAIEGWQRLSARGYYSPPPCMIAAIKSLQESNDPIGTWAKRCVSVDPNSKIAPADLFASFAGWYYQENGDGRFTFAQNGFSRDLKVIFSNTEDLRSSRARYIGGLRLNEDGLEYWSVNADRDVLKRVSPASSDVFSVNLDHSPKAEGIASDTLPTGFRTRF